MPEKETIERAKKDLQSGKSPTTAAGEFVRQEMHHIREGKHGAKNTKQAIAIGLSEARRAGVPIPDKSKGKSGSPARATRSSKSTSKRASPKRSRAALKRLKREPRAAASHRALSRQARSAAKKRPASARSAAARKAASTRARSSR
jgi:hypothetical protein